MTSLRSGVMNHEPLADNLVDRRFDERSAYPFSLPPSIAEVRDELVVVLKCRQLPAGQGFRSILQLPGRPPG